MTDPVAQAFTDWKNTITAGGTSAYANALVGKALTDFVASRASHSTLQATVTSKTTERDAIKAAAQTSQNTLAGYTGQPFSFQITTTAGQATATAPATGLDSAVGGYITATPITVGTGLAVSASTDKITATAHGLANGDVVVLTAISGPTTLSTGQSYFVVSTATNDFKLALASGGSPIDIDVSGTVTVTKPGLAAGSLVAAWSSGSLTLSKAATSSGTFTVAVQTGSLALQDATIAELTAQKAALTVELQTITDGLTILNKITNGRTALQTAGHYLAPRTILRDGASDQTSAIATWLGTVPDGADAFHPKTAHLWRSSTYRVDGTITLTSRANFRWDHHSSTFTAGATGTATRVHVSVEGCTQTRIIRPKIRGSLPAGTPAFSSTYAGQHGIQVLGGSNIVIDRPDIDGIYGSGVRIGQLAGVDPNTVRITGTGAVGRCGNHVLGVAACDALEWTGVSMGSSGRDTIAVSPATGIVFDGVNLHDFHITGAVTDSAYFSIDGAGAGKINNLTIDAVTADSSHGPLIANIAALTSGTPHTNVTITDNVGSGSLLNSARAAWLVTNATNLIFTGNTQPMAQSGGSNVMFGLKGTTIGGTVTVSGNTLTNSVDQAIIDGVPKPGGSTITITSPTSLGPFAPGVSLGAGIQFTVTHSAGGEVWSHSVPAGGTALPTGVTFSSSGLLAGTPGSTTAGTYTHRFTVTDSLSQTTYVDLTFTLSADLSITTAALSFTAGVAAVRTLAATGGTSPYHWSLNSGTLPAGFTLDDDGDLHADGTQTAGSPARTFKVQDSASTPDTDTRSITITIAASGGAFQITGPSTLGPFAPGVSLGAGIQFTSSGGTGTITWSHSIPPGGDALPNGVTFSPGGLLAGTPQAGTNGSYTHRFTATDSSGTPQVVSIDLTFQVKADLQVTTSSLGPFVKGTASTDSLIASGGTGSKHWTVSGTPALPAAFTLDDDGTLHYSGGGTAGTTNVNFKVTDELTPTADTDTKQIAVQITTSAGAFTPQIYPADRTWIGLSAKNVVQRIAPLKNAGVDLKIIRLQADLGIVYATQGSPNWGPIDTAVLTALNAGVEVVLLLTYGPSWLSGGGTHNMPGTKTVAAYAAAWGAMCADAVDRYCKGGSNLIAGLSSTKYVRYYELWNEPNLITYMSPPNMDNYADLVAVAYDAMKDVTGWCSVGCGPSSVTVQDAFGKGTKTMLDRWAATGYTKHARGWANIPADMWFVHPYCGGRLGSVGSSSPALDCTNNAAYNAFASWTPDCHNVLKAAGFGDLKLWGTEFGPGWMTDALTGYGRHTGNNQQAQGVSNNGGAPERKIFSGTEAHDHIKEGFIRWMGTVSTKPWPTGTNMHAWSGSEELGPLFLFGASDFLKSGAPGGTDADGYHNNPYQWEEHYGLFDLDGNPKRGVGSADDGIDALIAVS